MDLKKKYKEETKRNPYCWTKSGQYVRSGSYSDDYVNWLEKQLSINGVMQAKPEKVCNYCLEKVDELPDDFGCKNCIKNYK